jgi:pilus assembly protein CpaE
MMSVQSEADYLRRSMLAGARDFLTKPFSGDEMITTIRRVYKMGESRRQSMPAMVQQAPVDVRTATSAPSHREGKIVAVFSPKGGTGCTVLAVNLAIALYRSNEGSVVLVDGNLQFGDIAVMLDLRPTHTIYDLMDHLDEMDDALVESVLTPHSSGVKALLSPPRPEMADYVTAENLQRVLDHLKRQFDFVVVDTWTSLHDTALVALDGADLTVLVTTPDISSLRNVRMLFEVTDQLGYSQDRIALVVNKMDRRKSRIQASDIEESLKHPVTAELPVDDAVPLSVNQGVPIVMGEASRTISQGIVGLAQAFLDKWAAAVEEAQKEPIMDDSARSRLGRFFR